jgi:hypothetical protein
MPSVDLFDRHKELMNFNCTPKYSLTPYDLLKQELHQAIDHAQSLGQRSRWMGDYSETVFRHEHRALGADLLSDEQLHKGIKPFILEELGGKRGDAYASLGPWHLTIDVKFHTLGVDQRFWLPDHEVAQYNASLPYYATLAGTSKSRLVFYVIPVEDPIRAAYIPFATFLKTSTTQTRWCRGKEINGLSFPLEQLKPWHWTSQSLATLQLALDLHT